MQGRLWRQTKVRALLAFLAINNGHPIHQELLLERLWPDMNSTTGRHNLYTTVHNLRRSLEPDLKRTTESRYILYENNAYLLNQSLDHWLDVALFENDAPGASRNQP
ncbi:MAG: winged helix-turn-helix domain-containing protein [Chloroflexi bacterium]|nr:winged helix-turn-helix domain-containing protein [Chloroflexota bacterium]